MLTWLLRQAAAIHPPLGSSWHKALYGSAGGAKEGRRLPAFLGTSLGKHPAMPIQMAPVSMRCTWSGCRSTTAYAVFDSMLAFLYI